MSMSLYVCVPLCFVIILFDFLFFSGYHSEVVWLKICFYSIFTTMIKTTIFPSLQFQSRYTLVWRSVGGPWGIPSGHCSLVLAGGGEQVKGKTHLVTLSFPQQ